MQMFEVVGWKQMEWLGDRLSTVEAFNIRRPNNQLEWVKLDEIELLECTGVQDKNGRDIFEGDIIEYYHPENSSNAEDEPGAARAELMRDAVIYGIGYFCAEHYSEEPLQVLHQECEIIGNMYENPELLEIAEVEEVGKDLPN